MVLRSFLRQKLSINNSCELILGGENGDALFLISRSKNQFFQYREMLLGWAVHYDTKTLRDNNSVKLTQASTLLRFSFGPGEWRDGPAP